MLMLLEKLFYWSWLFDDVDIGSGAIICELCGRLCYERMDYNHHFKRRHLGHFNIQCTACGKGFWKNIALRQHACFPELREENIRLQQEKESKALRQRDEVRASNNIGDRGDTPGVVGLCEPEYKRIEPVERSSSLSSIE